LGEFDYNGKDISFTKVVPWKALPGKYWLQNLNYYNDSMYISVVEQPLISEKPYMQDFENDTHYWAAIFDSYSGDEMFYPNGEDRPAGWELGIPEGSVINAAASGSNAWYTYNNGVPFRDVSAVVSPCFDLGSYTRPVIEFKMWRQLATMDMGAVLQSSVNGGGWNNIGYTGDTLNWYTDPGDYLWVMERFGEPILNAIEAGMGTPIEACLVTE